MKTTATWVSDLAFDVTSDNNHTIRLDTTKESGSINSGMSPKQVLLGALCACSGIDVLSIIDKMRVTYSKLYISAMAEQTAEHPKVFKSIEMLYRIDTTAEDAEKVEKAIHLSHEKYCGISAMLKKHCDITFTIELI
jgi:putative redox protein